MAIVDARLNYLMAEKHKLVCMFDQKQISDEEYAKRISNIESEMTRVRSELLVDVPHNNVVEPVAEEQTEQVEKKTSNKKHSGRLPDNNSFSHIAFIILESGRAHSIDEALLIFKEVHPGKNDKQYKQAMLNVIARVKRDEKRYIDYMWDEEAFQMVKKDG